MKHKKSLIDQNYTERSKMKVKDTLDFDQHQVQIS